MDSDVTIIGGGVVGCAIAYELASRGYKSITLIERNSTIPGLNQSSRNGGILHSGIFYPKDIEPLKAALSVKGGLLMEAFCKIYGLPCAKTGKLMVSTSAADDEFVDFFYKVGVENGTRGIKKLSGSEAMRLEPNLRAVTSAIYLPEVAVVAIDPLVAKLKELAERSGVKFMLNSQVVAIQASDKKTILAVESNGKQTTHITDVLINAAGPYSDKIAKMINPDLTYEIESVRSELYEFDKSTRDDIYVSGLQIYQRPYCYYVDTRERTHVSARELHKLLKKGLVAKAAGAHVSPMFNEVDGEYKLANTVAVGPLKTIGMGKEDYTTNLKEASDYIKEVKSFFPNLRAEDLKPRFAGIMATLKGQDDFVIERDSKYPNCIQLVGIDSPGFTSSLAIAEYVRKIIEKKERSSLSWVKKVRTHHRPRILQLN